MSFLFSGYGYWIVFWGVFVACVTLAGALLVEVVLHPLVMLFQRLPLRPQPMAAGEGRALRAAASRPLLPSLADHGVRARGQPARRP